MSYMQEPDPVVKHIDFSIPPNRELHNLQQCYFIYIAIDFTFKNKISFLFIQNAALDCMLNAFHEANHRSKKT